MTLFSVTPMTGFCYTMNAEVSAYTATGNPMANGEYPYWGAVANNDLPLGTRVKINGCYFTVTDRMAAGYSGVFDIYMPSYSDAINWGRQNLVVEVL